VLLVRTFVDLEDYNKTRDSTKAVKFCFLSCISHINVYRSFYVLVVRLFTGSTTGTTPVPRLRMCGVLPLLTLCLRRLRRENLAVFYYNIFDYSVPTCNIGWTRYCD